MVWRHHVVWFRSNRWWWWWWWCCCCFYSSHVIYRSCMPYLYIDHSIIACIYCKISFINYWRNQMMRIMTKIIVLLWWWWLLMMMEIIVNILVTSLFFNTIDVFEHNTFSNMYVWNMFLRHIVLTVNFIHHRNVEMLSIGPVAEGIGM